MILLFCQNMRAQPLGSKWAKQWGDDINAAADLANSASTVKVATNGDVYVAGVYQGIVDFDPGPATYSFSPNWSNLAYVTRLDSNGNFIWTRQIGAGVNF